MTRLRTPQTTPRGDYVTTGLTQEPTPAAFTTAAEAVSSAVLTIPTHLQTPEAEQVIQATLERRKANRTR